MAHDVFISYSSKDKTVADAVCATLESRKIRCWIAPRDVPPGKPYAASLVNAISESRVFVLVLSEGSNQSSHVLREVGEAVDNGIPILPLRIENVEPSQEMRYYIKSIHWLDAMTPPLEKHLETLSESVQALLSVGDNQSAAIVEPQPEQPMPKTRLFPKWVFAAIILAGILIFTGFGIWALSQNSFLSRQVTADDTAVIAGALDATPLSTTQQTSPVPPDDNNTPPLTDKYTWTRKAEKSKLSRWSHSGAYDVNRGIFVIFGGQVGESTVTSDTLEYDGVNLELVKIPQSPPPRVKHRMVYDSNRRVIVLFGGTPKDYPLENFLNDTWEYDGNYWEKIETPHSPTPRFGFGMAYDSCRNKTVLFGGFSDLTYISDTWEYDGSDWTEVDTINLPPTARSETAMAFDSDRCLSVLFGGETTNLFALDDTWEYDGNIWLQRNFSLSPMRRWNHAMAFNPVEGKVVLYGGYGPEYPGGDLLDDTWVFDGQTWADLAHENSPGPLEHLRIVFDAIRKSIVLFGHHGDVWYLEKANQ